MSTDKTLRSKESQVSDLCHQYSYRYMPMMYWSFKPFIFIAPRILRGGLKLQTVPHEKVRRCQKCVPPLCPPPHWLAKHQRPELILCEAGPAPPPHRRDHLPNPPPVAQTQLQQLVQRWPDIDEVSQQTPLMAFHVTTAGSSVFVHCDYLSGHRGKVKLSRLCFIFTCLNSLWMILVYELIKKGLWKIEGRLSEVAALSCDSAGFKVSPAEHKKGSRKGQTRANQIQICSGFLVEGSLYDPL